MLDLLLIAFALDVWNGEHSWITAQIPCSLKYVLTTIVFWLGVFLFLKWWPLDPWGGLGLFPELHIGLFMLNQKSRVESFLLCCDLAYLFDGKVLYNWWAFQQIKKIHYPGGFHFQIEMSRNYPISLFIIMSNTFSVQFHTVPWFIAFARLVKTCWY